MGGRPSGRGWMALALRPGRREIGDAFTIAKGTVKAHVNSILAKLEARDRTDAAMIALKRGIIRFE